MLPFLRSVLLPNKKEGGNVAGTVASDLSTTSPMPTENGIDAGIEISNPWLVELPEEVALHILSFLPARDLGFLAQTCKYFTRLTEEKELWKRLYFSISKRPPVFDHVQKLGWKSLYLWRLRTDYSNAPQVSAFNPSYFLRKHAEKYPEPLKNDPMTPDLAEVQNLGGIGCLGVYADKGILIGGTMRGKMMAIDVMSGELLRCFPAHKATLSCLSIDQNLAVTGSWDTTLQVWDLDQYEKLATLSRPGEIGYIRCCQVDKSRGLVVSGSNDNSVKTWDIETGTHLNTIRGHDGAVTGLSVHNDLLVTGSWDRTVRLWSLEEKNCSMVLRDLGGDKYCVIRYDPVQQLVYGGREDTHIAVFDVRAGKLQCRLSGHTSWVYGLAFDDSTLFSGSMDGKVRIWDREKNESYNELTSVGTSCVHSLLIYDTILYAANEDSTIRAMDFSGPLKQSRRRG